ncbi:MAG: DUF5777 family beta-barrel protein [Longimicrobiales bacterium]|nr:DUF5777 family beta-barrel protein [Longimicrobiales bacterium]
MTKTILAAAAAILMVAQPGAAQEQPVRWQRRAEAAVPPVTVFHSTQSANLATAETLRKGEWLFEISHRFLPPLSGGAEALWGLDGPVFNRLGLAYAVSDRTMLSLVRSNLADNLELGAKVRLGEGGRSAIPFMVALNGGVAWNTQLPDEGGLEDNESQAYAQLVANALLGGRFAVGVSPTVLRNPRVGDVEAGNAFALGLAGQLYLSEQVSLLTEWVVAGEREGLEHDAGTFGLELETGGHFFKLVLSNSARMNPTQFLGGTPYPFNADEWRLGFNITRVLLF